jgi:hypothetical protein
MRVVGLLALAALLACAKPPDPKEYSYPEWGFAASFREAPKVTDSPGSTDGTRTHTFLVENATKERDELVYAVDGSQSTKSEDRALTDAPANLAKSVGGTLGPITYAAAGKVVGREFLLTRPGRPVGRVRVFVFHKHLYEVIAQSDHGPDDPDVERFLASFRLLEAPN